MDTPNPTPPPQDDDLGGITKDNFNDPQFAEKIKEIFLSPAKRDKFLATITSLDGRANKLFQDRQNRAKLPYYKEGFARELMDKVLDPMLLDNEPREFRRDGNKRWSEHTLYQKISQAFYYIVDYLDTPEKKYAKLQNNTEVCKIKNSVVIQFKTVDIALNPTIYREYSNTEDIKKAIDWIVDNGAEKQKFELPTKEMRPFSLKESEIEELNTYASKLTCLVVTVSSESIVIVKLSGPVEEVGGGGLL